MCLGIPGQVVEVLDGYAGQLALVDVQGATRRINLGMLEPDQQNVVPGDWVLLHMGFAVERIDRAGADRALDGLRLMGSVIGEQCLILRWRSDRWAAQDAAGGTTPRAPVRASGPVLFARYAFPPNGTGTAGRATPTGSCSSGWPGTTRGCGEWPVSSPAPGRIWS